MIAPVAANPDFRRLWAAQAVSGFGARITRDGLPMMAVMALAATPAQLGLLGALGSGPALIVGRLRRGGRRAGREPAPNHPARRHAWPRGRHLPGGRRRWPAR